MLDEEDSYSELYSPSSLKPNNNGKFSPNKTNSENSIQELDAQLSKFNKDQKVQEESTHSFLAKMNARITSHYSDPKEDDFFFNGKSTPTVSNQFVAAEADSRFILQKTANYYFPDINEGKSLSFFSVLVFIT